MYMFPVIKTGPLTSGPAPDISECKGDTWDGSPCAPLEFYILGLFIEVDVVEL